MEEYLRGDSFESQPLSFFIADDDPDDRAFIIDALKLTSYKIAVTSFDDGFSLWQELNSHPFVVPDLFLIDINMPVISGFELVELLNKSENYTRVPKIILSTSHNFKDIQKSKDLNCIAFFTKPVTLDTYSILAGKIMHELQVFRSRNRQIS